MKKILLVMLTFVVAAVFTTAKVYAATSFSDVPNNHWAADAVALLKNYGYPMGYADNTFRGDRNITRYELAGMMAALLHQKTGTVVARYANPFSDLPNDHYFYNAVTTLASEGIIEGYGDGTFRGDRNITRYEMALNMAKLLASANALGGSRLSGNPFSDVPSNHWAYNSLIALASKGVINAYGNARFNGDRYATRYEVAMMVAKAAVAD